jgi:hypothetical protein
MRWPKPRGELLRSARARWTLGMRAGGVLLLLAAIGFLFNREPSPSSRVAVGFVIDLKGEWVRELSPAEPLRLADEIYADQVIAPRNALDPGWVRVHLRNGDVPKFSSRTSIAGVAKPQLAQRIYDRLRHRYFVVTTELIARGNESGPSLRDGIAKLTGKSLDLADVFVDMPAGEYLVQFEPITIPADAGAQPKAKAETEAKPAANQGDSTGPKVAQAKAFLFDKTHPATLLDAGVKPGLFCLHWLDEDNGTPRQSCWILAASPEDYDWIRTAYRDAARRLDLADAEPTSERCRRGFLRAYLSVLADGSRDEIVTERGPERDHKN